LLHSEDRTGVKTFVGSTSMGNASHFLPPPHLGEHTFEILQNSLKFSAQLAKCLADQGVIAGTSNI
jgi:hypothetical protein